MSRDPDLLAEETVGVLRDMEIPDQLKHSIATYQEHLSDLAASLLAEGFDDETVERSLKTAFDSYREEVLRSILLIKSEARDA